MTSIDIISPFCTEIKLSNGRKCENYAVKGSKLCHQHTPKSSAICAGYTRKGNKCKAYRKSGSLYCRPDHDPSQIRSTDTYVFRVDGLRKEMEAKILFYRKEKDLFTDEPIDIWKNPIQSYHLDHVVELNLGRDVYDKQKNLKKLDSDMLRRGITHTFNQDFNLGLTLEQINLKKTSAMQKFGQAYKMNDVHKDGISFYLTEAFHMATRAKTSKIIEEVTTSFDLIRSHMTDNNPTTSVFTNYDEGLEDLMRSMRIGDWEIDLS